MHKRGCTIDADGTLFGLVGIDRAAQYMLAGGPDVLPSRAIESFAIICIATSPI